MEKGTRIIWIDWSKSLCMMLVVFGHCHLQESILSHVIYSFHIPLFFFLSGLLCSRNIGKSLLVKDIRFLLIPYLFYGSMYICISLLLSHNFNSLCLKMGFEKLILGTDSSIGPIWFLPALFICKQLFYIINIITKNIYIYLCLTFIFVFPSYFISQYNLNLPFFFDSALFGLPFFMLGNISKLFVTKKLYEYNSFYLLSISLLLLCITLFFSVQNGFVSIAECKYGYSFTLYLFNAVAGIFSIVSLCGVVKKEKKFVIVMSYGTIVTLGLHPYFFLFFNYYLPKILHFDLITYPFYLGIIYTIIIYICCYYIIIAVDKYIPQPFGLKGKIKDIVN